MLGGTTRAARGSRGRASSCRCRRRGRTSRRWAVAVAGVVVVYRVVRWCVVDSVCAVVVVVVVVVVVGVGWVVVVEAVVVAVWLVVAFFW